MIPQVLVRATDGRPYNIQDLLPADARFKILVFTGDTGNAEQMAKVHTLATDLEVVLGKYTRREKIETVFDIFAIT